MSVPVGILDFELAGQQHALWLEDVREVVRSVSITPLPGAPEGVEGVFDLHGVLVPVLDLRARLGLPEKRMDESDHFIVVQARNRALAIRVDAATGVSEVERSVVESGSRVGSDARFLVGIARLQDGLVLIHDLERFLNGEEEEGRLDSALASHRAGEAA